MGFVLGTFVLIRAQPIYRVFPLLFVPSAFIIAGVSAGVSGRGLGYPKLARSLFWQVGLTATLTFLVVNLMMETLGWVIGAPNAAEQAFPLISDNPARFIQAEFNLVKRTVVSGFFSQP